MTDEQKGSLDRVKASHAFSHYSESLSGSYHTTDIGSLLGLLEEQSQKLICLKDDLEDLSLHLKSPKDDDRGVYEDDIALSLIASILMLLSYEE